MKFGNLILIAAAAGSAVAAPAKEQKKRSSVFQWVGINESGAEFGEKTIPGEYGTEYIFPDPSSISTLIGKGMNIFRIQFLMERLVPNSMTGSYNADYLANLTSVVDAVTKAGSYAILDPHNYGRFNGEIITSTDDFQAFWKNLAGEFKSNDLVIFDTNNEYHDMDQDLVLNLNQAAINGIRAAGATEQYIFVEGNSWSGAWTWPEINDNMKDLTDPRTRSGLRVYHHRQGKSDGRPQWLKDNGKVGILGEFAGGVNKQCRTAISGMLEYMADNTDVWKGAMWWAAGPWWGDYMFNMEPETGAAYKGMLDLLEPYLG
ncbi:glycoside hydrolase family 5 protein [Aspergillus clavatus NRRL 1]|uniref:cellulase n=1 Tax=Aspergillus clavatus (strain ATCC 1007 / CBS 513.65 / DSM 816 / NCTC 3887 / NRRL 1 / QM 1276 / 107) TaxID=344612 RepID=A1CT38_ASPCL|nr:cellulase, putative [Aspergillus clavatus NRRL 1]EAW06475.1 cellulase, putative [Aspergillus clavatus NRRL 1]